MATNLYSLLDWKAALQAQKFTHGEKCRHAEIEPILRGHCDHRGNGKYSTGKQALFLPREVRWPRKLDPASYERPKLPVGHLGPPLLTFLALAVQDDFSNRSRQINKKKSPEECNSILKNLSAVTPDTSHRCCLNLGDHEHETSRMARLAVK